MGHFYFMNYRKLYAETFGIKIPSNYDVHHLDFDHSNNDLSNLVLLPRALHNKIHKFEREQGLIVKNADGRFNFSSQLGASVVAKACKDYAFIAILMEDWLFCKEAELRGIKCRYNYDQFRV